jgi:hypothetical protein
MKADEIIRRYYEAEIDKMPEVGPSTWLEKQIHAVSGHSRRLGWEDLLGAVVTLGYLTQLLIPANWFSFGRFLFIFRFGF